MKRNSKFQQQLAEKLEQIPEEKREHEMMLDEKECIMRKLEMYKA